MTKSHPNFKMQNYLSCSKNTQRINKQDIPENSTIFVINYTEWSSKQYNIILKLTVKCVVLYFYIAFLTTIPNHNPPFESQTISATCQVLNILNLISIFLSGFKDLFYLNLTVFTGSEDLLSVWEKLVPKPRKGANRGGLCVIDWIHFILRLPSSFPFGTQIWRVVQRSRCRHSEIRFCFVCVVWKYRLHNAPISYSQG